MEKVPGDKKNSKNNSKFTDFINGRKIRNTIAAAGAALALNAAVPKPVEAQNSWFSFGSSKTEPAKVEKKVVVGAKEVIESLLANGVDGRTRYMSDFISSLYFNEDLTVRLYQENVGLTNVLRRETIERKSNDTTNLVYKNNQINFVEVIKTSQNGKEVQGRHITLKDKSGFIFVYQYNNTSSIHIANISLYTPSKDDKSGEKIFSILYKNGGISNDPIFLDEDNINLTSNPTYLKYLGIPEIAVRETSSVHSNAKLKKPAEFLKPGQSITRSSIADAEIVYKKALETVDIVANGAMRRINNEIKKELGREVTPDNGAKAVPPPQVAPKPQSFQAPQTQPVAPKTQNFIPQAPIGNSGFIDAPMDDVTTRSQTQNSPQFTPPPPTYGLDSKTPAELGQIFTDKLKELNQYDNALAQTILVRAMENKSAENIKRVIAQLDQEISKHKQPVTQAPQVNIQPNILENNSYKNREILLRKYLNKIEELRKYSDTLPTAFEKTFVPSEQSEENLKKHVINIDQMIKEIKSKQKNKPEGKKEVQSMIELIDEFTRKVGMVSEIDEEAGTMLLESLDDDAPRETVIHLIKKADEYIKHRRFLKN